MVFSFIRKVRYTFIPVPDETLLAIRQAALDERDTLQQIYNLDPTTDYNLREINRLGEIADQAEELYMRRNR